MSQNNVPPLARYNFDTREHILIFLAEMLPMKQAIKRHFNMPPEVTCTSALPGKTGKHENHIFHSNAVLVESAAAELHYAACTVHQCAIVCDVFDSVYI